MSENKVVGLTISGIVLFVCLCTVAHFWFFVDQAKASRQYRVSVYASNLGAPARTWVVSEYTVISDNVISFESLGKRTRVCNNWVVEEQ